MMVLALVTTALGLAITVWLVLVLANGPFRVQTKLAAPGEGGHIVAEEAILDGGAAKGAQERRLRRGGKSRVTWRRLLLAYVCMLIGMLSVAAYQRLKAEGRIDFNVLNVDVLISLCVSPIVFRVMLNAMKDGAGMQLHGLALCAFENGFCWQGIIGEMVQ